MAALLFVFILQLLFGTCRLSLFQNISADLRSVHPGENTTLHCSISAEFEMSWYLHSSEGMKQLFSAERGKLNKLFSISFNVDEGHYEGAENSSSVSLVILGVKETDLGLYYCGGRNRSSVLQFGKAIRLIFTDDINNKPDGAHNLTEISATKHSAGYGISWIMMMILVCTCLLCVLMNIVFMCGFCWKGQGKSSSSSCNCCSKTREKEVELQYASLSHEKQPRAATADNTLPSESVTMYAKVTSRLSRNLET
ncbi:uncharacterized protein [Salminus brasiliensis]|uniref:uncharacterized protein n=1 Tax=Salminus brasiliensis TaxID=930266 RepID=UPI003B8333A1